MLVHKNGSEHFYLYVFYDYDWIGTKWEEISCFYWREVFIRCDKKFGSKWKWVKN